MIRGRSNDEIERYDIFKVTILVVLAFILLLRWSDTLIDLAALTGQPDGEATTEAVAEVQPDNTTIAEIMPVLNPPTEPLTAGQVELSGSGAPGSTIAVAIDGQSAGSALVGDGGTWALTTELTEPGDHEIGLRALDANGEVVATAEPVVVTVAPAETAPFEVAAPTLSLVDGEVRPAGEITLTGTGQPEFSLEILFNGQRNGTTLVGTDGQWSYTTHLTEPGNYQVQVYTLDREGKLLAGLVPSTLIIAAVEPEPTVASAEPETETPATTEPAQIAPPTLILPEPASFTAGEIGLSGAGQPGTEVQIVVDGNAIGTATVDDTGQWSLAGQIDEPGTYEVVVRAVDEAGTELASSQPATLTITPATEPTPDIPEVVAPTLDLSAVENPTTGEITLTGTGQPGAEVEVLIDGVIVGIASVDEDGSWQLTAAIDEAGEHEVSVQMTDAEGQLLVASEPARLTVAAPAVAVAAPIFDIPTGDLRTDEVVSLSGTGEPDTEIEILIDGESVGTATVDGGGVWTLDTEFDQTGDHEVVVQVVDADGNVLAQSEPATLTVEAAPVEIVTPTLELPQETALAGRSIVFRGTGGPGDRIELLVDGESAGTVLVSPLGRWLILVKIAAPGDHEINAQVISANGTVLASSDVVTLTVDEPAVVTPTVNLPQTVASPGSTITLRGTGSPGATVEILVDGQPFGTTTVGDDGNWRFEVDLDEPGDYEIEVRVIDQSGEVVAVSEPATLTIEPETEATPETTAPAPETETTDGQEYIVQQDDWLSKLSDKFYGDIFAYDIIVDATNAKAAEDPSFAVIEDPDVIEIGQKLWVPNLADIDVQ